MSSFVSAMEVEAPLQARLVGECVEGRAQAWRRLHQRYYPIVVAFLRKLGVGQRDLEDATQEVFLQVHKYLPRFRGDAELSTWLYRLCVTEARRTRRRTRVTDTLMRMIAQSPGSPLVSTPGLPEDSARQRIERALAKLPDGERAVFVLYEMEGLPGRQIAEIVGCPEATVFRRLHYARSKFRAELGA